MRIESVRIQNFRSFEDAVVPFNKYACLVGPNGAGKSTVLTALNVFFGETDNLPINLRQPEPEDFHCKNTDDPIHITVTFCDLTQKARDEFSNYVRQGRLVVSAVATFDEATGKAQVKQYGQRLGMTAFRPFFEALDEGQKVANLKDIYRTIRKSHSDLPAPGTKAGMETALHEYEASRPGDCVLIPSQDQFYGFSRGVNRLARHVQWVYIPAVKDATVEQVESRNSALGKLLARTVRSKTNFDETITGLRMQMQREYQDLLDHSQDTLDNISSALQNRMAKWAHPEVRLRIEWKQDPDKSVRVEEPWAHILAGEGQFEGELARFGHGLQRSYLLALLQELSGTDDATGPTLILGCEEPELYQHPPQARHLAAVLNALSQGNAQVIVSTHDPLFVSGQGFEDVRMVRKDTDQRRSKVSHMSFDDISRTLEAATGEKPVKPEGMLAKIHQALQPSLNEMFFTGRLILVEGLEDIAYLWSYIHLLDKEDEFRSLGGHIVATNGKSQLLQPLVIARHMKIPTYVMFDADADKPDKNGSQVRHRKDNSALLALLGRSGADPMPAATCSDRGFTMWQSDIGTVVEADIGKEEWESFRAEADNQFGHTGGLRKSFLHVGASLSFAWQAGKRAPSLERLCAAVLEPDNYL